MDQPRSIPDHDALSAMFEEQARREDAQFRRIADKIERDPTLLLVPLENISRWTAKGHWAGARLAQWKEMIESAQHTSEGMERLLAVLRDDGEEMRFLKGFAPFPGVLSREEAALPV